jgi:hypothetical protein
MHDFDRITAEYETLIPELEAYPHGFSGGSGELEAEGEAEAAEMEQAAALLDVRNEQELENFLGDLINTVSKGVSNFANSSVGQALGGVLKNVAKTALPIAGKALGTYVGGPAGGMIGGQLASAAGDIFGLELEGLSGEDREFEVARRFVRFARSAARNAARSRRPGHPQRTVRSAVMNAAQQHAPGLLRRKDGRQAGAARGWAGYYGGIPDGYPPADGDDYMPDGAADDAAPGDDQISEGADGNGYGEPAAMGPAGSRRRGTWIRRGRRIILFGV